MSNIRHPSSYRDPKGYVLRSGGRIFRLIEDSALNDFKNLQSSGILDKLSSLGHIVATWKVKAEDTPSEITDSLTNNPHLLVEHEFIPFISYPYEWPFALLKKAAILYLELYLELLESNFALSDGSAYNIQFIGTKPIFIDILSICPYREGEYWAGYKQFCEQFLNPLLLTSLNGVAHQSWLRGSPEGIPIEDMAKILPLHSKLSWRVQLHVHLHAKMYLKSLSENYTEQTSNSIQKYKPMPKSALIWLLKSLRTWISELNPRAKKHTLWKNYEQNTSYDQLERESKREFISRYANQVKPQEVLDIGCNTGNYSQIALASGVKRVIGIDFDHGAIDIAVARSDDQKINLLPLIIDAMNPSPNQGWAQREWLGFSERTNADGLLALAFLHHIIIGKNVPIEQAIEWLVTLAPSGVIEFVPKNDPMVKLLLANRVDIFPKYNIEFFRNELSRHVSIINELVISSSGRTLFEFKR